jgi:uncharacterized protein DUF4145
MNQALLSQQDAQPTLLSFIRSTVAILWKDWPTKMFATALDIDKNFSLSGECPHCRRDAVFNIVSAPYWESEHGIVRIAAVMQCPGCLKLILGIVLHIPRTPNYDYEAHYPLGKPNETVDPSVPQDVAEDFKEAIRCQWVQAYRACVVMCRRALQTSVLLLNAAGGTLIKQIEDLAAKGVITAPLKDFAHEIRLTGNAGAHSDGLTDVKEADAEAIVEFTREFFDHVYVMPAKLKARKPQGGSGAAPQKKP